jgi:hypothetical protein
MGIFKAKEPSGPKVSVRPTIMIITPTYPFALDTPTQDAPQSTPHPLIKAWEDSPITMLEVFKPSSKGAIHICNDTFQRIPIRAPGFHTNSFFQFLQALLPRPSGSSLKMIPKEVEALARYANIHQSCLLGIHPESFLHHLPLHKFQRSFRFLPIATYDDKVSNAEEPPLYVLSEPGVNFSAHRAPIIQPPV